MTRRTTVLLMILTCVALVGWGFFATWKLLPKPVVATATCVAFPSRVPRNQVIRTAVGVKARACAHSPMGSASRTAPREITIQPVEFPDSVHCARPPAFVWAPGALPPLSPGVYTLRVAALVDTVVCDSLLTGPAPLRFAGEGVLRGPDAGGGYEFAVLDARWSIASTAVPLHAGAARVYGELTGGTLEDLAAASMVRVQRVEWVP